MKKRQALVVGINDYLFQHELRTPANDANAVAQKLMELGFEVTGLPSASTQEAWRVHQEKELLTHELEGAITKLFALNANVSIPETALLFFAGHGLRKEIGNFSKGFLATSRVDRKESWGFPLKELREILEKSPVKQQIVILDCCYAGELLNFDEADPGDGETISRCFIAACREFEPAYEPTTGEHSILTEALLQGLQQEGFISNITICQWIETALKTRNQTPICRKWGEIVLRDPGLELPEDPPDDCPCPYKGLEAFQEEDAKYFFGREKLTQTLVNRLRDSQLLAVLGISGSGKSSVVRAGLIPNLKQGKTLSESKTWKICAPFTPGDDPLASLAQVLVNEKLCTSEQATQELAKGAKGLHRLISPANAPCVFVVDQFEQVFTPSQDPAKRKQFFDCLLGATDSDSLRDKGGWGRSATSPLRVIITMRADFLGKCAEYPQLAKLIETHQAIVTEMKEAELREAIGKPAKKVNWNIPPDLENLMVADVQKSPGSLPLLQDILKQLWHRRSQRLTVQTYQDMGGVQKALQNRANKVYYQTLSSEQQAIARSIFLKLTQLLENSKPIARQVRKSELTDLPYPPEEVETVLEKLEAARLIVTSELEARGNPEEKIIVVDVAHESLISNWKQLERWVKENFDAKRQEEDIQKKTRDWADKGKRREGLLRGLDLAEVELFEREHSQTFPLSPLAREFVRKSIRQRRNSRLLGIGAVVTVFSVVTGLWLNAQRQATIANLRANAAQAQHLLSTPQPLEGLVLAIQATGESQGQLRRVMSSAQSSLLTGIQTTREQNRLRGHQGGVNAVAISPDGETIVSGSWDDTLRLWNRQGEQLAVLRGHQSSVTAVAISPDGETIVSGSGDNTLRLWNRQGEQLAVLRGHQDWVTAVAISPDGETIVSGSWDDTLRLWNRQGEQLAVLRGHQDWVSAVAISPDGETIVSGSSDDTLRLWNRQGEQLAVLRGHQDWVSAVAISPDGETLVSGSGDNTLRLWNRQGEQLAVLRGHQDSVRAVAISPDGETIVSGSLDDTLRLWNRQGEQLAVLRGHQDWVSAVAISPDGETIVSGSGDNTLRLWNRQGEQLAVLRGHQSSVTAVAISPDGETIVSGSWDDTLRLWNRQGEQLAVLRGHQSSVTAVAISPDGETIVSGSWDDTLRLWNRQGEQLAVLRGHQDWVNAVAISPDGETIVSGSRDRTLRLWNRQGEQLAVLRGHQDWVNAVAISPDGETIVSGSRDRTLRLWNRQGEQLAVLRGHQSSVRAVAISPDGETIVSGSLDDTLRLWNRQGEQLAVLRGHQSSVNTVAISPDGETLVSGSGDNTLRLWNRQGEQLAVLRGHQSSVYAVAISPDGETIVSGSSDDTLRLWRLGNWTNWLQIVCNQLKYHPVLVAPETDVARDAGETCQNHAWTPSESAQFLVNQGKSLARAEDIEGAVAKFNQANKLDATLDLDPEAEAKQIAVPALIEAGNDLAYQGDYHEAVAKFQQALTLDPTLDLDPEAEAKQIAVPVLLARGEQQVEDQDYQAAVEAYTAAQTIDATLDISADTWNEICWFGSLRGEPEAVMPACEQAVTLEPEEAAHRGNLGLAKALTGETEGAIQEFQAFIELSNNAGANRLVQGYINTLRAGDNPFTEAEIQRLLGEESNPVPSSRY